MFHGESAMFTRYGCCLVGIRFHWSKMIKICVYNVGSIIWCVCVVCVSLWYRTRILSCRGCVCVYVDFLLQVSEVKQIHQTRKGHDNSRSLAFPAQKCSKSWSNRQVALWHAITERQYIFSILQVNQEQTTCVPLGDEQMNKGWPSFSKRAHAQVGGY